MADLERQYSTVLTDCSLMAWPLEAVSVDDSASSDSRPEADHCSVRFYMGPFMSMLFEKVASIPKQKYEIDPVNKARKNRQRIKLSVSVRTKAPPPPLGLLRDFQTQSVSFLI